MFFLSISILHAQKVTISGVITDKTTGESALGANVKLKSKVGIGASSDLEGHFSFEMEKSDNRDTLLVSYIGYNTYSVYFTPNQNRTFNISLVSAYSTLEDITVTAKLPIAEDFVIQKLDYLKIVTNPSSYADPLLAVRTSVSATNTDESASPSLRGANPDQTRLFLNEVPIYDPVKLQQISGIGTFSLFNARLIKSQLVFPSNPPLEYGNAGSGLIHITTSEQLKKEFLEISGGLASSSFIVGMPIGKKNLLNLFGNYQSIIPIKFVNPQSFNRINSSGVIDGGFNFCRSLAENSFFKIYGYGINESYNSIYQSPSFNGEYIFAKKRVYYAANFQKTFSQSNLSISNGVNFSTADAHVGNYNTRQTNKDVYGNINYQYFFSDYISSKSGVTYDYRFIESNGQFPIKSYALSDTSKSYQASVPIHRYINELFVYSKYSKYPFTVGAGLRKNIPIEGQSDYWSYQLNSRYEFTHSQFLSLAAGRYHNFSSPSPAYYPFLMFQTDQLVLDYSVIGKRYSITSAIYAKKEIGLYDVQTTGFEIYISHTFAKNLTGDIAFSTISANSSITDINLVRSFTYNPSLYDMKYNIKSNIRWDLKWVSINALFQARQGSPYTPIIDSSFDSYAGFYSPIYPSELYKSRLSDYFRADITFTKILSAKSLIFYVTLSNILNTGNVSGYYYNFDYSTANDLYFQKRFIYFGFTKTFSK